MFQNIDRFFEELFHEKISAWTFWATCTHDASENTCTYEGLNKCTDTCFQTRCLALFFYFLNWAHAISLS